jgi:hypothetical protein
MTEQFFKPEDIISIYTSEQAVEDGILFDVDIILAKQPACKQFFLKYVTTGLLEQGYWNNRCNKGVLTSEAYISQTCTRCEELFKMHKNNKPCLDRTLNIPNLTDLLNQATRIFRKKPVDDYFVSGIIELPSGQKQKIFIAQNETGRYTAMLPEEY